MNNRLQGERVKLWAGQAGICFNLLHFAHLSASTSPQRNGVFVPEFGRSASTMVRKLRIMTPQSFKE